MNNLHSEEIFYLLIKIVSLSQNFVFYYWVIKCILLTPAGQKIPFFYQWVIKCILLTHAGQTNPFSGPLVEKKSCENVFMIVYLDILYYQSFFQNSLRKNVQRDLTRTVGRTLREIIVFSIIQLCMYRIRSDITELKSNYQYHFFSLVSLVIILFIIQTF